MDEGSNELQLYERDGGFTKRASAAIAINAGTPYDLRLIADGQQLDGFLDGGNKISYGSAALNELNTTVGLWGYDDGDTWDNFACYARTAAVYDSELDTCP